MNKRRIILILSKTTLKIREKLKETGANQQSYLQGAPHKMLFFLKMLSTLPSSLHHYLVAVGGQKLASQLQSTVHMYTSTHMYTCMLFTIMASNRHTFTKNKTLVPHI